GSDRFEREKHSISSHGGRISELRDIHLLIVILQHVASQAHGVRRVDIDDGLRQLREREKELIDTAMHEDNIFRSIESGMLSAENRVDEWPVFPDSIGPLMPGLEEVYADGRACYRQARENPGDSDLHAWGQQVHQLMHLFEILAIFWAEELGISGPSLHQLSGYLGEEHDLALFMNSLKEGLWTNKLKNPEALISYADQKRSFLRRSAMNLGGFVYKRPVDAFVAVFREKARAE
ncbi:MAG: hypothetical protein R3224_09130, partial [Balneolaceae bacterium]|nr:hypothetical protein [Balneolaceae bacterium]